MLELDAPRDQGRERPSPACQATHDVLTAAERMVVEGRSDEEIERVTGAALDEVLMIRVRQASSGSAWAFRERAGRRGC